MVNNLDLLIEIHVQEFSDETCFPFSKVLVFSPCSQRSNRNFGRNVRRRLRSSRKFCFNRTRWLRFIPHWLVSLVSGWSVWQNGKNPGPMITSRTLKKGGSIDHFPELLQMRGRQNWLMSNTFASSHIEILCNASINEQHSLLTYWFSKIRHNEFIEGFKNGPVDIYPSLTGNPHQ